MAQAALREAEENLSQMVHAKIIELASEKLHSRRQMYIDAITTFKRDGVTFINLDASAAWIDDGLQAGSQIDDLLASPKAKRSADGVKYLVIPFEHSRPSDQVPESQKPMVDAVRAEMKKRKIPLKKLERDEMGRPLIGRVAKFNINNPLKTGDGAGQGWGQVGDVRRGPSMRQKVGGGGNVRPGDDGVPFLANVNVYQKPNSKGKIEKSVMTFRIVSSEMEPPRWKRTQQPPVSIMAEAYEWAQSTLETEILPQILSSIIARL